MSDSSTASPTSPERANLPPATPLQPPGNPIRPPTGPPPLGPEAGPQGPNSNVRRTIAVVIAALGAILLGIAATTFVSVRWEQLALLGKASVLAGLAVAAIGIGLSMRDRLPGAGNVLVHLGGFLLPIDLGAFSVALGANRAEAALVGGFSAVTLLEILDLKKTSVAMAVGRTAGVIGTCVGVASVTGLHPAAGLIGAAAALLFVRRTWEPLILSVVGASSAAVEAVGELAQPGSLLDWVADLVIVPDWQAILIGFAALGVAAAANRKQPGMVAASLIVALNAPAFIRFTEDRLSLLMALFAAALLAVRAVIIATNRTKLHLYLDEASIALGAVSLLVLADESAVVLEAGGFLPNLVVTGALLLIGVLAGDGHAAFAERDWRVLRHGRPASVARNTAGGPSVTSFALAAATGLMVLAVGELLVGATILAVFGTLMFLGRRPVGAELGAIALGLAPVLAYERAETFLGFALLAVALFHGRSVWNVRQGGAPVEAGVLQGVGFIIGTIGVVFASAAGVEGYPAAAAIAAVAVGSALSASLMTRVPDVATTPRLFLLLAPLPLVFSDLFGASMVGFAVAALLLLDSELLKNQQSAWLAAVSLTVASWALGLDQSWEMVSAYTTGPALALVYLALRNLGGDAARGHSSQTSFAFLPGMVLLVAIPLVERGLGANGWLAVVAGAAATAGVILGATMRLRVPTVIGVLGLLSITAVEVAAFVPVVPVWAMLGAGGTLLLLTGVALERQAGSGAAASLKAAWAEFV